MPGTVRIGRAGDVWVVAPEAAPTVLDAAPELDVLVLEVVGGHLTWSLLAGQAIPAAVIDDLALAQEWIWALYGEAVAVAIDGSDGTTTDFTADPALPELVGTARRLAFAHWATRWWPASGIDGITPLDERLLEQEIRTLQGECELLLEHSDADPIDIDAAIETLSRAEDYALAAGAGADTPAGGLPLARGTAGWDWRRCPPGLIDASERAISWESTRTAGTTTIRVDAVAAPQLGRTARPQLRPRAFITTPAGPTVTDLDLIGDTWTGTATTPSDTVSAIDIYVPGVGPLDRARPGNANPGSAKPDIAEPDIAEPGGHGSDAEVRQRIRELAAARLRQAADFGGGDALLAEIAAAASDSDF